MGNSRADAKVECSEAECVAPQSLALIRKSSDRRVGQETGIVARPLARRSRSPRARRPGEISIDGALARRPSQSAGRPAGCRFVAPNVA